LSVRHELSGCGCPSGTASPTLVSLRLEKGYRSWGPDIGPDHSPAGRRPLLGREAEIENSILGTRRARDPGHKAAAAPARRFHHRSRDRAARARNHLSRRQVHRLAHEICGEAWRLGGLLAAARTQLRAGSCAMVSILPVDGLRYAIAKTHDATHPASWEEEYVIVVQRGSARPYGLAWRDSRGTGFDLIGTAKRANP
jgi:hypothetical protein